MRRSAVLECLKQEAELVCGLFRRDAKHVKHTVLNVVAVDTHGAATHFVAVAHDVVGIGHGVFRILVELVDPILGRHGERVMHCGETVLLIGPLQKRELGNPYETVFVLVEKSHLLCQFQTKCAKNVPNNLVFVSSKY